MSENSSSLSSTAFADALARARQLAAKLGTNPSGSSSSNSPPQGVKRSAEEVGFDAEPQTKRAASMNDPFGAQLAAMKSGMASNGSVGLETRFSSPPSGASGALPGLAGKTCSEEIKIPHALVGLVIGRGGEQVSRVQAETGCKVQVAPDNGTGQDRPVYLQGSREAIERAKDVITEIVSSKSHEVGPGGGGGGGGGPGGRSGPGGPGLGMNSMSKGPPGSTTAEMMIPGQKVGLIIGKGGETIRNLQDKTGTKMFILQENMFEECDKPLRIVGSPELVEHAKQLVLELINDTPPKHDFRKNDFGGGGGHSEYGGGGGGGPLETMRFPVPKISVGLIIGKGGEMIKRIQMETGAKVQFDPINSNLGDMDEQLAIITGKPDQIRQAQLKIEGLVETALNGGAEPEQRGGRGGGGGGRDFHNNSGYGRGHEEERMTVPVNRVGMVIGKGGETIRQINQQSGAHSEIDRNGPNDGPERVFLIRGSRQQIEHAKELIMEKVNTLPPKHQRGHQDHYGGGGNNQHQGWGQWGGQQQQQQQQWGQQSQGDPSKMGDANAQWAAYYAQYYAQSQAQPQQAAAGAGAGGQDYTLQWIEYLRSQGQHQQADMLEQQMKATKGQSAAGGDSSAPAPPGVSNPGPPGTNDSGATNGAPGGPPNGGGQADFSQQWADHYRSIGKIQEAEAIENYIKAQKQGGAGAAGAAAAQPNSYGYAAYGYYPGYAGAGGGAPAYGYPGGQPGAPGASNGGGSTAPPGTTGAAPPPGTED